MGTKFDKHNVILTHDTQIHKCWEWVTSKKFELQSQHTKDIGQNEGNS